MFDVNWEARSHADIHAQLQGRGGGFTDAGGAWNQLASRLRDVAGTVERATGGIAATRTGVAAQAAQGSVGPMGAWAAEARTFSDSVGAVSYEQNRALASTRAAVGPPVARPAVPLSTWEGVGALAALDVDSAERTSSDAANRARAAMGRYQEFSSLRASELPRFAAPTQGPPQVGATVPGAAGAGGPLGSGGAVAGSPGRGGGAGGGGAVGPGPSGSGGAAAPGGGAGAGNGAGSAGGAGPGGAPGAGGAAGPGAATVPGGAPGAGGAAVPGGATVPGGVPGAGGAAVPGGSAAPGSPVLPGGAGAGSGGGALVPGAVPTAPGAASPRTGPVVPGTAGPGGTAPGGGVIGGGAPTRPGSGALPSSGGGLAGTSAADGSRPGGPGGTGGGFGPPGSTTTGPAGGGTAGTSTTGPGTSGQGPTGGGARPPVEPGFRAGSGSVLEPALGGRTAATTSGGAMPFAPLGGTGGGAPGGQRLPRAGYLVEDDPDAITGGLPRVVPPVIGDDRS